MPPFVLADFVSTGLDLLRQPAYAAVLGFSAGLLFVRLLHAVGLRRSTRLHIRQIQRERAAEHQRRRLELMSRERQVFDAVKRGGRHV